MCGAQRFELGLEIANAILIGATVCFEFRFPFHEFRARIDQVSGCITFSTVIIEVLFEIITYNIPDLGDLLLVAFLLTEKCITNGLKETVFVFYLASQAFGGRDFSIVDEIYQFRDPYSRENVRVLLSLDPEKTDMKKRNIERKDGDFAVAWIRQHGEGRVFYCSLGHREDIYWNPQVLQFYLDGLQYVLGDLDGDATASN